MMKTGTQLLSEAARHVIAPVEIASTGWPSVRDTCRRLGWDFDPWQDGAGRLILSKRADGLYAADTILMSIPRQVGKTYLTACIIFALCLLEPGLTVIWTAHRRSTAAETFAVFDGMSRRPKVAAHVLKVLRGASEQRILFNDGSRIIFGARETGFGRGFSDIDVLVFDECQIMTEATLEDMAAAQNVAANPLMFMIGTPPRPKDPGEMFTLMRQEALDGDTDQTLYIEFSADRATDLMDREQWRRANPSFPVRTSERAMLRLRKKLKVDDSWRREALGIWDELSRHQPVIKAQHWAALVDIGPAGDIPPDCLGIDMSHDRRISVAACWIEDDSAHLEEVWAGDDVELVVDWVADHAARPRRPVLIDALSPASALMPELKARRINVRQTTAGDMVKGCGLFENRAKAGTLTHADQVSVNEALEGGRKRMIRDAGGWGWDRKDPTVAIHPIVAATLALLGATSSRRKTSIQDSGRKAVILT